MIAKSLARLVPAAMLAACLLSAPALAQQPSAAAINAARELVELKGGATMFDPVIVSVIEQTKAALLQTNPQLAKDLNDVATQLRAEFTPRRNELMNEAAKLYAAAFTEQEIKDMTTFYKSPLGKKMLVDRAAGARPDVQLCRAVGAARRRGGHEPLPRRDEEEGPQSLKRAPRAAMADFDTDLFVIGGGSGGVRAARIAAGYGARVMLAEEYRVGGTCVIRGCVPKKLLVYASRFAHEFEEAAGFGWTVEGTSFDWATLIANKDKEIARLEAAYTANLTRANVSIFKSRAVLEDAHTVRLLADDRRVRAKHILIATGAWPGMGTGIAGIEHVISSNEAFHLTELPKRILIQGGGYIAVEFACIFAGLGSEVTLVYRGENILRGFDDDIRTHLRTEMERRGIKVICKRIVEAVEKVDHGLCVELSDHDDIVVDTGDVRDRTTPEREGAWARGRGRARQRQGRDRGRSLLAHLGAAHLRGRRRHRPHRAHAGRDPRGPRLRRHGVRQPADRGRSCRTCRRRCSPSRKSA